MSLSAEYGDAEFLQHKLNQLRVKAEKIIQYAIKRKHTCPMDFLKRTFHLPDCWNLEQLEDDSCNLSVFYQIMVVSSHKTEKALKKYIKVDHIKKACMIKKLWDNQSGL